MWNDGDEDYDVSYPPPLHPLRELTTMIIAALLVLALAGWGVSALWGLFK
jgi:hypothetical protein